MIWLYNAFIRLYVLGIRIASIRNQKAGEWVAGRKNLLEELSSKITQSDRTIWFHCASAGELEQGKPLIEECKKQYPEHKIVISFFSPSGFAAAQKYQHADVVTYLPADTPENAKRFVELLHPELVVFVKYEYWYHHLAAVAFRHIPLLLISAIFREEQVFFKWYGSFYRQLLFLFRQIFVQDEASLQLLRKHNINHCSISGDTRFDRVKKIAGNFSPLQEIENFKGRDALVVAGSTWPDDERFLEKYIYTTEAKLVIAPHEISESHIRQIKNLFSDSILFSEYSKSPQKGKRVLIIDNFGMLSKLYHYADITYIGGGFNKSGIHNTLEAAVYGKPVIFGPHYQKFKEARELVSGGGAFSFSSAGGLEVQMDHLLYNSEKLQRAGSASKDYVEKNTGATAEILHYIQANRLLTR